MKKLMIAAAIVCAAVVSQAAQFMWAGEEQVIAGYEGGSGTGASGNGYLLWSDATGGLAYSAAEAILADWAAGTVADLSGITGKAYKLADGYENPLLDGGTFEALTAEKVTGDIGKYYALFITEDTVGKTWAYLSSTVDIDFVDPYGSTDVVFENDGSRSAAGTGWYTQSVPEPTSGLLLLLGMASLALKRRHA